MLKDSDVTASHGQSSPDVKNILSFNSPDCWTSEKLSTGRKQWIKLNVSSLGDGVELFDLAIFVKNFGKCSPQTLKITLFPFFKDAKCARANCPCVRAMSRLYCCANCENNTEQFLSHSADCASFCNASCSLMHAGSLCGSCGKNFDKHNGHSCKSGGPRGRFTLAQDDALVQSGFVVERTVTMAKGPDGWFTLVVSALTELSQ